MCISFTASAPVALAALTAIPFAPKPASGGRQCIHRATNVSHCFESRFIFAIDGPVKAVDIRTRRNAEVLPNSCSRNQSHTARSTCDATQSVDGLHGQHLPLAHRGGGAAAQAARSWRCRFGGRGFGRHSRLSHGRAPRRTRGAARPAARLRFVCAASATNHCG